VSRSVGGVAVQARAAADPVTDTASTPTPSTRTLETQRLETQRLETQRLASRRRAEEASRFAAVLEEHGAALRRAVASYERDPALQEDLYQDVCLALWRALGRFRSEASLRTFVLRIAHNRGVSHLVRQVRRGAVDEPMAPGQEAEIVALQRGPEDEALGRERAERLRAALRTLPIGLRQAVTLRLEGLAHREIAEVLGISENAVAIRLSRARSRLEETFVPGGPERRDAGRGAGEDGGTAQTTRDVAGTIEEEEEEEEER